MNAVGKFGHRALRFFTSLSAAPPPVGDEVFADRNLTRAERALWIRMTNQDRRHSARVARRFVAARPEATRAEIAGALLHDVGKLDSGLGTFARVAAVLAGPRGRRFDSYHRHEAIGAELVAAIGSDPATVELVAGRGPADPTLRHCDRA